MFCGTDIASDISRAVADVTAGSKDPPCCRSGRTVMLYRSSVASIALAAALCAASAGDGPLDKFPDWKGQWIRIGAGGQYDPTKPGARGQQPPLTPEYQ